jgi:hypothetical protein
MTEADGSFVRILISDERLQQPNYFIFRAVPYGL